MYSKCGDISQARSVFDIMQSHDVVSWNTIILGYAENGQSSAALTLFARMRDQGCQANRVTFLAVFKACSRMLSEGNDRGTCLQKAREVHLEALKSGYESDIFLASSLMDMYSKCGSMSEAREVFNKMERHDTVTWNALFLGYTDCGDSELSLQLLSDMQREGCVPDSVTYIALLKACSRISSKETGARAGGGEVKVRSLEKALAIHAQVLKSGLRMSSPLATTLVSTYACCGSVEDARHVFDGMSALTTVSWNAIILAYAENRGENHALGLFVCMEAGGFEPNRVTFLAALKACGNSAAKEEGQLVGQELVKMVSLEQTMVVHSSAVSRGCDSDCFVVSTLVSVYSQCGSLADAERVFGKSKNVDLSSWNAMILGYAENRKGEAALSLYTSMQDRGCASDRFTVLAALKACSSVVASMEGKHREGENVKVLCLEEGRNLHLRACELGLEQDVFIASSLVDMYTKCGRTELAREVFEKVGRQDRNLVLWNTMILGYADNGQAEPALAFLRVMQEESVTPDARTYVALLKACGVGGEKLLETGRRLHMQAVEAGVELEKYVASALIDMYIKCGSLSEAKDVFARLKAPDAVLWTVMIQGLVENGEHSLGLELYTRMQAAGCVADTVTFVSVLKACGSLAAIQFGRQVVERIKREKLETDSVLVNSVLDFYGKCGCMDEARGLFEQLERKDSVSWNALIAGYSRQGNTREVFGTFERMKKEKYKPDGVTYLCVLATCNHSGLVEQGKVYFERMVEEGVSPGNEHYCCMVDMLGRRNEIESAVRMVKGTSLECNMKIWMTILDACRTWRNVEFGELAFAAVMKIDNTKASAYVLMQQIYSSLGMWKEHARLCDTRI